MALVTIAVPDHAEIPKATISTSVAWGLPWIEQPNIYVTRLSSSSGSSIDTAEAIYEYGEVMYAGDTEFTFYSAQSLLLKQYVKITWTDQDDAPRVWYGVIVESERSEGSPLSIRGGTQRITCMGLDWLLTRTQILDSVVQETAGATNIRVPFGIPFNGHRAGDRGEPIEYANQANVPDIDGNQVFDKTMDNPRKWNATDIVKHLLTFHMDDSPPGMTWVLDTQAKEYLDWYEPHNVVTHGRTVFAILNEVIDRRRGLIWWAEVDEDRDEIVIKVDSMAETNIELPDVDIPANNSQIELLTDINGITESGFTESAQRRYDQVIVEGARRGVVCTLWVSDGTLEADWDAGDESAYASAASAKAGYVAQDRGQQIQQNDSMRMHDDRLSSVYTHYRLAKDWDGLVIRDGNDANKEIALPLLDSNGDEVLDGSDKVLAPFWLPGIRVENMLPLFERHDYSDPANVTNDLKAGTVQQHRRSFATIDLDPITRREYADKLSSSAFVEGATSAGYPFNCSLYTMDTQPGIIVKPNVPSHVLGSTHFNSLTAAPSDYLPVLNWQDVSATVYLTFADHVRVAYPDVVITPSKANILLIRIGDKARLDYMPRGTMVDLDAGVPVYSSAAAYVRDDRQMMRDLARTAFEWYVTPRQNVQVTAQVITSKLEVGQLITSVNSEPYNAAITNIVWDFERGSTTIRTEFAELDFEVLSA